MAISKPDTERPSLRGASDTWDSGPAGLIVTREFFVKNLDLNLEPKNVVVSGSGTFREYSSVLWSSSCNVQGSPAEFIRNLALNLEPGQTHMAIPKIYAVFYEDAFSALPPTNVQIRNGRNPSGALAIWSGNEISPTATGTFDWPTIISGLNIAPGDYRIAMVWTDESVFSNVSQSATLSLVATIVDLNLEPKSLIVQGSPADLSRLNYLSLDAKDTKVQGFAAELYRSLILNLESRNTRVQLFDAELDKTISLNLESGSVKVSNFDASIIRSAVLNLEPRAVSVQGFNTGDSKSYALNLEPRLVNITGTPAEFLKSVVFALDPRQVNVSGANTNDVRTIVFSLDAKTVRVEGFNTDAGSNFVFPLDSRLVRTTGFDLQMQASKFFTLDARVCNVQGSNAELTALRSMVLEPKTVQVQKFDAALYVDRILVAVAREVKIQGFDAQFIAQKFILADAATVRVQGFPATFVGAYVYPDPANVKYGVTYGPSGSDFTGSFVFDPRFDVLTGSLVDPSTYRTFAFNRESNLTVLTADLVKQGILYGVAQTGNSIGYVSYDINTGRIAKPISNKALLVV